MPIDPLDVDDSGEDIFVLKDPSHEYTYSEVCDLLNRAKLLGFSLERGSELEGMTIRELEVLVTRVQ